MVETKPFKTKLCALYQRGRCGRQTCTFAHGNAELRRYSGSFNDRRSNRGHDLRNKLDRKRSPLRRYSPERDARGHAFQRISSPRPIKRRKHEHMDGQSDFSGSFKASEETGDQGKDKNIVSSDSRYMLEEELKQVQYELDVLLDQKSQLKIELEERVQEADSLSSRIRDLEAQLSEEKDKSKGVNSKIKKLIRAHIQHRWLQDELKRSQVQYEKLIEELGFDATRLGAGEDGSNINIISDEEVPQMKNDLISPAKKQLNSSMEASEGSKLANITKGNRARVEGSSRRSSLALHFEDNGEAEVGSKRKDTTHLQSNESKPWQRKDASKSSTFSDKPKVLESNHVVPPTSMAAHAVDDFVELVEPEERTAVSENGLTSLPPPLPPVSKNNYAQYEGDNETVDVDGFEEELQEPQVDIV